jgi:molybdenum cofactor cytidylyltransferase
LISAIILAAGLSRRMGRPKLTLPWGSTTVIRQVASTLLDAGIEDIIVVRGDAQQNIVDAMVGLNVRVISNSPDAADEMLVSFQTGLRAAPSNSEAAFVCLGDQPQIQSEVVQGLLAEYNKYHPALLVPSYQKRRGHPWLVTRNLWEDILGMESPQNLRDFLNQNQALIRYFMVNTPTILYDLDTPADYERHKP